MTKHRQHAIPEIPVRREPYARINDQERRWINQVLNGSNKQIRKPTETPIECPPEYESYYEATLERLVRHLERQLAFLKPRLAGLSETISQQSKRGIDIPKTLWAAHTKYMEAVSGIEAEIKTLHYADRDFNITQEVATDA